MSSLFYLRFLLDFFLNFLGLVSIIHCAFYIHYLYIFYSLFLFILLYSYLLFIFFWCPLISTILPINPVFRMY